MTKDLRDLINLFEISERDLDRIDRTLYQYVRDETGYPGNMHDLYERYPLEEKAFCFRGLNFDSKEDYDEFIAKVKFGPVELGRATSWSVVKSTAETFAQFKQTYNVNLAIMNAHKKYENSKESIHGYRGILLGMTITPDMQAVDVRKFKYAAEDEILLPSGTYELKIIKTFSKFEEKITANNASSLFMAEDPNSRLYEYIWLHFKDQLSFKARVKYLKDRLAGVLRMRGVYASSTKDIDYTDRWIKEVTSTYFKKLIRVGIFPIDVLELAQEDYFPQAYNRLIIKMGNACADKFIKDYQQQHDAVMDKHDKQRVLALFIMLGRENEFTNLQRAKFKAPYDDLQGNRVKQINSIKDPEKHREAMDRYLKDITDLFDRI